MKFKLGELVICSLYAELGHISSINEGHAPLGYVTEYYVEFGSNSHIFIGEGIMRQFCTKVNLKDLTELDKLIYNITKV